MSNFNAEMIKEFRATSGAVDGPLEGVASARQSPRWQNRVFSGGHLSATTTTATAHPLRVEPRGILSFQWFHKTPTAQPPTHDPHVGVRWQLRAVNKGTRSMSTRSFRSTITGHVVSTHDPSESIDRRAIKACKWPQYEHCARSLDHNRWPWATLGLNAPRRLKCPGGDTHARLS